MDGGLVLYFILVCAILLFAVCSNILVIGAVCWFRKLRTVTHVLICNLAVTDILMGTVFMPQKLHDMTHSDNYYEADSTCKFIHSFPIFIISSACYTLVFISFERRRAITECNKPQMTLSTVFKLLPVLWFSSLVVSIPTIMEYSVETYSSGNNSGNVSTTEYACGHYSVAHSLTVAVCFFVVIASFLIPLVLIFNNYIRVIIFVNKRCKVVHVTDTSGMSDIVNSNGTSGVQRNAIPTTHLSKNRLKIVKMLILMAATFAVCWLPYFLLYMYTKLSGRDASLYSSGVATFVLNILIAVSTAYNVVLYVIFNNAFRKAFKSMLPQMGRVRTVPSVEVNS